MLSTSSGIISFFAKLIFLWQLIHFNLFLVGEWLEENTIDGLSFERVWSRILVCQIQELSGICEVNFWVSLWRRDCLWRFIPWWTYFPHFFTRSLVWISHCLSQDYKVSLAFSKDERRNLRHLAKIYLIIDDTLYHRGVNLILRRCLNLEEDEVVLNDFHSGACGGHLSGLATTQKFLCEGYFGPRFSNIVLRRSKNIVPVRFILGRYALI